MSNKNKNDVYQILAKPKQVLPVIEPEIPNIKQAASIELYHSASSILNTALNTLGTELAKLRVKSANSDTPIKDTEVKMVTDIIKTLLIYEKQQADLAKSEEVSKKLSEMSDEEFLELAKKSIKESEK